MNKAVQHLDIQQRVALLKQELLISCCMGALKLQSHIARIVGQYQLPAHYVPLVIVCPGLVPAVTVILPQPAMPDNLTPVLEVCEFQRHCPVMRAADGRSLLQAC